MDKRNNLEVDYEDVGMNHDGKPCSSLIQERLPIEDSLSVVGQNDIDAVDQFKCLDVIYGRGQVSLKKIAKECNVSIRAIVEYLEEKGYQVEKKWSPNTKISEEQYEVVYTKFYGHSKTNETELDKTNQGIIDDFIQHLAVGQEIGVKVVGKIDLESINTKTHQDKSKSKKRKDRKKSPQEIDESLPVHESHNLETFSQETFNEEHDVYVPFSSFILRDKKIILNYNGKEYFQDYPREEYCNYLISKSKEVLPVALWKRYEKKQILVRLYNTTFCFVNFSLSNFILEIWERARIIINSRLNSTIDNSTIQPKLTTWIEGKSLLKIPKSSIKIEIPAMDSRTLPNIQKSSLKIDNIEFHDGFYMVCVLKDGEKNMSIAPLRIDDASSCTTLRFVQKYLSDRFPQGIQIVYTEKSVVELTDSYRLGDYVRELHDNLNVRGKWWEEIQNECKLSLNQCRQVSIKEAREKVSLKNGYLDSLSGMQNNKKLIPVYEINHGKQEDAFLFSIDMPNERCAIVFENISYASTATEIFIVKNDNYESCIAVVFDYFTDYSIASKRESLRRGINAPEKFNAEQHFAVNHYDLDQWMSTMFRILERFPKNTNIEFVPGLNISKDSNKRIVATEEISTQNMHNKLMQLLYNKLSNEYGAANVGTEIRVGSKRIDTVVKLANGYDIYEIKTTTDPFSCVTLALGQLCQYAYLFCRDRIRKMVIVGPSESTKEVQDYLSWFRDKYSLEVYYLFLPLESINSE